MPLFPEEVQDNVPEVNVYTDGGVRYPTENLGIDRWIWNPVARTKEKAGSNGRQRGAYVGS